MGTHICLTLEEFGDYLHLPSEGSFDENRHFDPSLFIQSGSSSKLNLHDHVLHLILTWNLKPIKKRPDLALILFNDIMKAIGRGMNTNITLP
ncbi:hypothetical protein Golob_007619, partial [Gossypium lobatum]|nr:hypothetical protein [Gossypium lobatum]